MQGPRFRDVLGFLHKFNSTGLEQAKAELGDADPCIRVAKPKEFFQGGLIRRSEWRDSADSSLRLKKAPKISDN